MGFKKKYNTIITATAGGYRVSIAKIHLFLYVTAYFQIRDTIKYEIMYQLHLNKLYTYLITKSV